MNATPIHRMSRDCSNAADKSTVSTLALLQTITTDQRVDFLVQFKVKTFQIEGKVN